MEVKETAKNDKHKFSIEKNTLLESRFKFFVVNVKVQ